MGEPIAGHHPARELGRHRALLAVGSSSRFDDGVPGWPGTDPVRQDRLPVGADAQDALAEERVLALERQAAPMLTGAPRVGDVAVPLDPDRDRRLEHLDRDVADVRPEVRNAVLALVVGLAAPRAGHQLDDREALTAGAQAGDRDQRQPAVRRAHDPVGQGRCERAEDRVHDPEPGQAAGAGRRREDAVDEAPERGRRP